MMKKSTRINILRSIAMTSVLAAIGSHIYLRNLVREDQKNSKPQNIEEIVQFALKNGKTKSSSKDEKAYFFKWDTYEIYNFEEASVIAPGSIELLLVDSAPFAKNYDELNGDDVLYLRFSNSLLAENDKLPLSEVKFEDHGANGLNSYKDRIQVDEAIKNDTKIIRSVYQRAIDLVRRAIDYKPKEIFPKNKSPDLKKKGNTDA